VKTHLKTFVWMTTFVLAATAVGTAQEKDVTPVKLQIVLGRYQGEKKVSSIPYSLAVNVGMTCERCNLANLRMGAKIPIAMISTPAVDGKPVTAAGPFQYQDVGTNIDAKVDALDAGRFRIALTIEDTSVLIEEGGKASQQPSFRSFRASNSMILKDGQTGQFTTATDKVSGEVTKVDVTLTVVK
jgi:hypothetical protein